MEIPQQLKLSARSEENIFLYGYVLWSSVINKQRGFVNSYHVLHVAANNIYILARRRANKWVLQSVYQGPIPAVMRKTECIDTSNKLNSQIALRSELNHDETLDESYVNAYRLQREMC